MYYSIIKRFYDLGVYSLAKVRDFVGAGVISPEQFITVFTVVISFYFGTQSAKRKSGDDE